MLDHYLHTAYAADRLLEPARDPIMLAAPEPGVTPEHPADHQRALAWFSNEHAVLLAAVNHAEAAGLHTHTWQLTWALADFLDRRGHWLDWVTTGRAAVAAANRLASPSAQVRAHHILAHAYLRLSRFDDAHAQLRRAHDLTAQTGDVAEQARNHYNLALVRGRQSRHAEALGQAQQALALFRTASHEHGQGLALNAVGWFHAQLRDHLPALHSCEQALALFDKLGDRYRQADTWDSLGYIHHLLGHHPQAITCFTRALHLYRDLGYRYEEADTLTHIGDTHHAADDPDRARHAWHQARTVLDELNHPDADQVRAKLEKLDNGPGAPPQGAQ